MQPGAFPVKPENMLAHLVLEIPTQALVEATSPFSRAGQEDPVFTAPGPKQEQDHAGIMRNLR